MRSYRLSAAVLALVAAVGCGSDNGPSNSAPVAKFSGTTDCVLLVCTFTDASTDADGTIASRAWTFEDGTPATSTEANPTVTFAGPGTYSVKLTVTDDDGLASAVADSAVTVSDVPGNTNPTADFTFTCTGLDCTFTDASSDADAGDGIASWSWIFGESGSATNTSTVQSPTHTYAFTDPTTAQVSLTVTDNHGGTGTVTKDVAVTPAGGLTCDNGSGGFVGCSLDLTSKSTVTVTLTTSDCNADGNTLMITAPVPETVFDDGCHEAEGTVFPLNGGAAYNAGTSLMAQVTSGSTAPNRIPPEVHVEGSFPHWTLHFDDGEGCAGDVTCGGTEPDFDDLILDVDATVVP